MSAGQAVHTLVLRAYSPDMLRLFVSMVGDSVSDESLMLDMAEEVKHQPLHSEEKDLFCDDQ